MPCRLTSWCDVLHVYEVGVLKFADASASSIQLCLHKFHENLQNDSIHAIMWLGNVHDWNVLGNVRMCAPIVAASCGTAARS